MLRVIPPWAFWLMLVVVLGLVWAMWMMYANLLSLRQELAGAGGAMPRTRKELEDAYTAGRINRDLYDRLKGRVK